MADNNLKTVTKLTLIGFGLPGRIFPFISSIAKIASEAFEKVM